MAAKRILIADDEEGFTRMVKLNLEHTGEYQVRAENRGKDVLAAAREFKPDLILLDVMMPDLDGGTVAAHIKADEELKDIPILFLTAIVTKGESGGSGRVSGQHRFIAKPVSTLELIEHIEKALG